MKSNRGGARPGSGMKPGTVLKPDNEKKYQYSTRLQKKYINWLRQQPNAAQSIEFALDAMYDIQTNPSK
jgi:hypothetical protein